MNIVQTSATTSTMQLVDEINRHHRECKAAAESSLLHGKSAGQLLIKAKSQVPHGGWRGWLADNVTFGERTAQRYMAVAKRWGRWEEVASKNDMIVSDLGISKFLAITDDSQSPHFSSKTPEWYTPRKIIESVVEVLGDIALDPCSNSAETPNVPARKHFTAEDDGLSQDWCGTVFLNPPYGKVVGDWIEKLIAEFVAGNVPEAIALLPARTDTVWFSRLRDFPRCFIRGRLKFGDATTSAPFPSVAVYLGSRVERFVEVFREFGDIYELASSGRDVSSGKRAAPTAEATPS